MLYRCNHCKENSIARVIRESDKRKYLLEYCINVGHKYERILRWLDTMK